ncbi:hypothetical protein COOONC_00221, partial [Cooperia oncophora]
LASSHSRKLAATHLRQNLRGQSAKTNETNSSVRADPEKIARIQDYGRPQNIIAKPLYDLTNATSLFGWTNEHTLAFDMLKKALTEAPDPAFELLIKCLEDGETEKAW